MRDVVLTVGILVAGNGTIRHTQRHVGIGEEGTLRVKLHECLQVGTIPPLDGLDIAQVAGQATLRVAHHLVKGVCGVLLEFLDGCLLRCLERGEARMGVEVVGVPLNRTPLCCHQLTERGRIGLLGAIVGKALQHTLRQGAVHRRIVILIEPLDGFECLCPTFRLGVEFQGGHRAAGQRSQFDGAQRLVLELLHAVPIGRCGIGCRERVEQVSVLRFVGCPGAETCLIGLLLGNRVEALQSHHLALPLLPSVGDVGMLGGILDTHLRVGLLRGPDDVEATCAQVDFHRVGAMLHILHGIRRDVLLGVAREAVNHREITLLDALCRDSEVAFRLVGLVLGRVGCRLVVGIGIDAEEREVARVTRPDPVVRVASKLTDRRGGSTHQTHVVELLVDEEELLVAIVHLLDGCTIAFAFPLGSLDNRSGCFARGDAVRHILHAYQDADKEPLVGELLLAVAGPKTVCEVVVLDRRMELDGIITAVVVREYQPLGRYDFARAEASEKHHGILHRGAVDAVDILGCEAESLLPHLLHAVGNEAWKPHALIGSGRQ